MLRRFGGEPLALLGPLLGLGRVVGEAVDLLAVLVGQLLQHVGPGFVLSLGLGFDHRSGLELVGVRLDGQGERLTCAWLGLVGKSSVVAFLGRELGLLQDVTIH